MKLTNRVLEVFGVSETAGRFYTAKFPVKYGWKIKLQREAIQGAAKALAETKKELIDKYCEKDKDGAPLMDEGRFSFKGLNASRFTAEFDELLSQEFDVWTEKIDIPEAVFDAAGNWSVNDLDALAPFINIIMPESAA